MQIMHRKYREKERAYWEDRIISHAKEPKRLWSTFNTLLGRRRVQPECTSGAPAFTVEDFLTSHTAKIFGIRQATEARHRRTILPLIAAYHPSTRSPRKNSSVSSLAHRLSRANSTPSQPSCFKNMSIYFFRF